MTSGPPPGTPMPPPMPPPFDAPMPPVPATGNPPQNGIGTAALVMGILQFVCLGPIGTVLAIIFGRMGMKRVERGEACLLYTSPSPRDRQKSRMPSSA